MGPGDGWSICHCYRHSYGSWVARPKVTPSDPCPCIITSLSEEGPVHAESIMPPVMLCFMAKEVFADVMISSLCVHLKGDYPGGPTPSTGAFKSREEVKDLKNEGGLVQHC